MHDRPLRFSNLKQFAKSPAHYLDSLTHPMVPTRVMRIGTVADRIIFGQKPPVVYEGRRYGKKWDQFRAEVGDDNIVSQKEWDEGAAIAAAAMANPVAAEYLKGRPQVSLDWEMYGFKCTTGGIDCVGPQRIVDLKVTQCTHPDKWLWQAFRMQYDAQLVFYQEACHQNGIDTSAGLFIVGVESRRPFNCTVLELTPDTIEQAKMKIAGWFEQLRVCVDSNYFPGYCQAPIKMGTNNLELIGLEDEEDVEQSNADW